MTSVATIQVDVEPNLDGFTKSLKKAGQKAGDELADGIGSDTASAKRAGSKWGDVFGAAAGLAIGAFVVKGVEQAFDLQDAGMDIAASLGLDAASKEAKAYGETAGDLYRSGWGDSVAEVGEAVAATVSSLDGLSAGRVEDITAKTLAMADAFGIDAVDALGTLGVLMDTGLARSAENGADALTRVLQSVPAAFRGEAVDSAREYANAYAALGLSAEKALGLIATGARVGEFGIDKAGDAIKEFTLRTTSMSGASTKALESIGLDAYGVAASILAGGETANAAMEEIVGGLLAIENPVDQATASLALFGTPLEDLGVATIPEFLAGLSGTATSLGDVDGAAQDLADTLGGSARAQWEAFQRDALGVVADFATSTLIPALTDILPVVSGIVDILGAVPQPVQTMLLGLTGLAVAANYLTGPLTAVIGGLRALSLAAATNPWIIIIAATIALAYIIATNWDSISAKIGEASRLIGGAIEAYVVDPVSRLFGWFERLPVNVSTAWDAVKVKTGEAVDYLKVKLGELAAWADKALGPIDEIVGAASKFGGGIIGGGARLLGFDDGGVVPGPVGAPRVILAHAGETVLPTHKDAAPAAASRPVDVHFHGEVIDRNFFESHKTEIARVVAREVGSSRRGAGL